MYHAPSARHGISTIAGAGIGNFLSISSSRNGDAERRGGRLPVLEAIMGRGEGLAKGERARSTCNRDESRKRIRRNNNTPPLVGDCRGFAFLPSSLSLSLSLSLSASSRPSPFPLRVAESLKFIPRAASKEDNER